MLTHTQTKKLNDEPVLFAAEAATLLGTSVATVWRCVRAGRLQPLALGDRRVFRKADVEALQAARAASRSVGPDVGSQDGPGAA